MAPFAHGGLAVKPSTALSSALGAKAPSPDFRHPRDCFISGGGDQGSGGSSKRPTIRRTYKASLQYYRAMSSEQLTSAVLRRISNAEAIVSDVLEVARSNTETYASVSRHGGELTPEGLLGILTDVADVMVEKQTDRFSHYIKLKAEIRGLITVLQEKGLQELANRLEQIQLRLYVFNQLINNLKRTNALDLWPGTLPS